MLHSTFGSIEEAENTAARALGREGLAPFRQAAVRLRQDGVEQLVFCSGVHFS